VSSPFADIIRLAVDRTPRAVGGAFAAYDGEMVDWVSTLDPLDWAILTAHYGVIWSQLQAAFNTWHFGGPEYFVIEHSKLDIVVHAVLDGYYALIAIEQPAPLGAALSSISEAVRDLRREMR
jgi:hypothetical protein